MHRSHGALAMARRDGAPWRAPPVNGYYMHRTHPRRLSALAALALLAACGGGNKSATAPRYQPQVVNLQNDFAFQVTALDNVSDDLQYTWQNDGTTANVNQSPSNLSGTATLVVRDAAGTQVYSRSLADNGSFATTTGVAGNWTHSSKHIITSEPSCS